MFAKGQREKHPLRGLIRHGPYGMGLGVPREVRLAFLCPQEHEPQLNSILKELGQTHRPKEATNYYPEYPGFSPLFRTPLAAPIDRCRFVLPADLDRHVKTSNRPGLAQGLFEAIGKTSMQRAAFDVLLL